MKIPKRVLISTVAAVVVLGIGGTVWATTASASDVDGGERERVANAATQAVPGTVEDVETSDDPGEAYEVEVRKADGTEVDVALDKDLKVVGQDASDSDDRVLSAAERASAEQAAVAAVGGGTVTSVEAGDDGVAYEVDVRDAANAEWNVDLDAGFKVLSKTADD
ncbi:hypothetical protein Ais01nite_80040 [Asanoa ishikariensis]|uniref:Peptidase propeptide and YPEB domain-containing protein n=1 Tax=Asanoa ishikariensis TaxID=137265 RepID=A0A1H3UZ43_9ACTN|nr:PepSY domain-containing protein [Asanoa ishikariensis]GIF69969.1 hypothetical protein Ais01nite_80040 [Asanoa ishikariensis]SDZ67089.1 Peptidase propeptide and YPEB domain-containing protein [Asanoa ishikariensis]